MPVKESSDELNASVPAAGQVAPRSASDFVALVIGTCGVGYSPIAPGTWGSLVGVGLYLGLRSLELGVINRFGRVGAVMQADPEVCFVAIELVAITLVALTGIWAASRGERIFQQRDPGKVVIDEVAGQLVALLPVPLAPSNPWPWWPLILISFLLFRAFDILKPYPVRQLETLESGLGIVVDDLAAGAYAAVVLSVIIAIWY